MFKENVPQNAFQVFASKNDNSFIRYEPMQLSASDVALRVLRDKVMKFKEPTYQCHFVQNFAPKNSNVCVCEQTQASACGCEHTRTTRSGVRLNAFFETITLDDFRGV